MRRAAVVETEWAAYTRVRAGFAIIFLIHDGDRIILTTTIVVIAGIAAQVEEAAYQYVNTDFHDFKYTH